MRKYLLIALLGLAACGGKNKGTSTPTPTPVGEGTGSGTATPPDEGPVVGPPDVAWKDMTHDQRAHFMGAKVVPEMKALFAASDPDIKEFNCETCHGDGAKDHSFKMPNPKLPVLPKDEAGFAQVAKDHPAMVDFMMKQVTPSMTKLLGLEEWSPQNPDGFGCGGCHTTK